MLATLLNFARKHIAIALGSTLFTGAFAGGGGMYLSLYEAKVNRVEEMKVSEFNELMTEDKKFRDILNSFTEQIAVAGTVDMTKRSELSASLARLYSNFGTFTVNLPADKEQPVRKLQSSIAEVKKHVQLTKVKQDLDPLAVSLVDMFRNMKTVQPIIEEAVGKPISTAG